MRALLDVNVIIALFDPDHAFHDRAHRWWAANAKHGWASCPITENGAVRIMSQAGYNRSMQFTPVDLISRLRKFASQTNHEFWPDDLSIREENIFVAERIHGSRQITDFYLLALAAKHGGRLATFDTGIPISGVRNMNAGSLTVI
jgi:toxin-antitoxin system PIN domain toxin